MKLFSWLVAILLILFIGLFSSLTMGFINSIFGIRTGLIITAVFPTIIVIYFIIWILMWNKGKAESPFKLIIELLSK